MFQWSTKKEMAMRSAILTLLLGLAAGAWPVAGEAFPVVKVNNQTLDPLEAVADSTTRNPLPREREVRGQPSFVIEGAFGIYTIDRCADCRGPARIVSDGGTATGVHRLILTDARIQVSAGATAAELESRLTILVETRFDELSGDGLYPHGVTMDGSFACRGERRCILPGGNRIEVSAFGGDDVPRELIKARGGTTEPSLRFVVSRTRSFARQGIENIRCFSQCDPTGILKVVITFSAAGDVLNLPGSIGLLGARETDAAGLSALQHAMNELLASPATLGGECGGGTPCSCGNTVMTSRTLASDPVVRDVCPGDGLVIGASDVVLTLKGGNTIRGTGNGAGILLGVGVSGVTVRSGGISGFTTGVRSTGNDGSTFSALVVRGNADAGLEIAGDGNTIDRVIAEANGAGIVVDGDGNVAFNNRAPDNGTGVTVTGNVNTVSRNVVERSAGLGMVVDGTGTLVERNQIASSGDDGLTLTGTGHTVSRNVVKLSGGAGLAISSGGGISLRRNTMDGIGGFGILDATSGAGTGGTANTYTRNVCGNAPPGESSPAGLCR
jgi:hypothetical protein